MGGGYHVSRFEVGTRVKRGSQDALVAVVDLEARMMSRSQDEGHILYLGIYRETPIFRICL